MTKVWVAVGSGNPCKVEAVRSAFESLFASSSQSSAKASAVEIIVTSHRDVASGVADQPYGDAETKLGAVNRANAAWEDAVKSPPSVLAARGIEKAAPDFAVGLEGGVEEAPASTAGIMAAARSGTSTASSNEDTNPSNKEEVPKVLWCMAWMAIRGTGSAICTMARAEDSPYDPPPPPSPDAGDDAGETAALKEVWGFGRTGSFELPPEIANLVHTGMELGEADDKVFSRVNSKHGSGTVGVLTNGMIDRSAYYENALKLALVPWIRPELYIELDLS